MKPIPPPPTVIKPSPIPPPPPVVKGSALGSSSFAGTANAHVRRVTLNLIRLSACCPEALRGPLDILANRVGWDLDKLDRKHVEMIYAYVDDTLAENAKAEFSANTKTIIDHRMDTAECKLCGHKHIRWEFQLENTAGGTDVWTGSTCIVEYGINVDGSATAEEALARLNEAINKAKRKAAMEDWQAAYPNHKADMARVFAASTALFPHPMYGIHYSLVEPHFRARWKRMQQWGKAAVRYYDREGFLTEKRTRQVFGKVDGVLALHRQLMTEWDRAETEVIKRRKFWTDAESKYGADPEAKRVFNNAAYWVIATDPKKETRGDRIDQSARALNLFYECEHRIPPPPPKGPKNPLPF